jgi:hypothetical protein
VSRFLFDQNVPLASVDRLRLVYRTRAPIPPGIIYLRSQPVVPESTALELLAIMDTPGVALEDRLTVLEPGRIRQRPLRQD